MKRLICTYISVVLMALLLTACMNSTGNEIIESSINTENTTNYESVEALLAQYENTNCKYELKPTGDNDGIYSLQLEKYEFVHQDPIKEYSSEDVATVEFNGKEYSGAFDSVVYEPRISIPFYKFKINDNSYFEIDNDGKLVRFISFDNFGNSSKAETFVSIEESIVIAKRLMTDFADIDQYRIEARNLDRYNYYEVIFRKYIGEIPTMDGAGIYVSYDGKIISYGGYLLGRIDVNDNTIDFDYDEIIHSTYSKVNEIHREYIEEYGVTVSCDQPLIYITLVNENRIGATVNVNVKYSYYIKDDEYEFTDKFVFVLDPVLQS